jgi:hypothetical protein
VAVLEGRQSERAIEPCVLVVADPDEGQLEQPDDGSQHLLTLESGSAQVRVAACPDPGQDLREVDEALELGVVASRPPAGVVAVLLPSTRVTPGGL